MSKKNKIKNTQDLINIDEIKDGIIHTKDGRYIKIIEVEPINFHLRSEREKTGIIYNFAAWLKVAPAKIQFKVISHPANIDKLVNVILNEIKSEPNEKCRELQKDNLDLICNVSYQEGVTRQFFIVMEFNSVLGQSNRYSEIVQSLNLAAQTVKNYLQHCGNAIVEHDDNDLFLVTLLFNLFNRSKRETIHSRMVDVIQDYSKSLKTKGLPVSMEDLLAPRYLRLSPDYLVINDMYYSFYYIPSSKYRSDVAGGWLAGVVNAGDGFDIDIFFEKQNKTKVRNKLGQQIRINKAKIKDAQDTNSNYDDLSDEIQSGYYIKNELGNNEDFYYMNILLTVLGGSLSEIKQKERYLYEMFASQDIEIKPCKYHMSEAFMSSIPLCNISKQISNRAKRNVLTYGAASTYPFTAFEITDNDGILMGVNLQNNSLCILDPFDSSKYKNANMCIMGTTGAGKTFTLSLMALRFRMKNIQVFIIAPLKGFEFKRACNAIGGQFIKLSPGSQNSINILEIRPLDKSTDKILDGGGYGSEDDSILSQKVQKVLTFFSLIIPDMSLFETQLVDNAVIRAYYAKGITHDNDSLIDHSKPYKNGLPQYKTMPILEDVYNELKKDKKAERLYTILERYVHGSAKSFNAQTNVDLNNKYTVIDISEFNEELQPVGMFVALDYIYDKVKEDRTKRKAVFIDETWKLIGAKSNSLAANYVLEMFKIIRGYGGAAIAATQDINDFFALEDGKYGKGIISNSKTKIILQLERKEAETAQDIFDLSDQEAMEIEKYEHGKGLLVINSNNVPIKITASLLEEELITTDRKRLNEIIEIKKMNQKQEDQTKESGLPNDAA